MCASSKGSGQTEHMCSLNRASVARRCDKYQNLVKKLRILLNPFIKILKILLNPFIKILKILLNPFIKILKILLNPFIKILKILLNPFIKRIFLFVLFSFFTSK